MLLIGKKKICHIFIENNIKNLKEALCGIEYERISLESRGREKIMIIDFADLLPMVENKIKKYTICCICRKKIIETDKFFEKARIEIILKMLDILSGHSYNRLSNDWKSIKESLADLFEPQDILKWLLKKNDALDGQTPFSVLKTPEGVRKVADSLSSVGK